ncbi:response regulator transcription factor [Arcobacter sp. FWKO B]|uniref:response regulator transcription factor n=1 Tax=Arcobacter sp. FWKO B TaxID=2593672 RepID=UPI0018A3BF15|nr:response regulator transcription factor [Arcobacter sp. FWKO B]QOG11201.1 response regulator transcription factor [Arcobacter sp. FWKO B]
MLNSKQLNGLLKELTILYVEDDINSQKEVTQTLKSFCDNVMTANNGKEALDIFNTHKIKLILSDIEMPTMNGINFIKEVRKKDLMIPVIMMTAHSTNDHLINCVNLNIQAYIQKPVSFSKLKEALYKVIDYLYLTSNILVQIDSDLSYDSISGVITNKDENIKLKKKEKSLMDLLSENKNKLVTYSQIEHQVWEKYDEVMSPSALRTLVKNLRKKLPSEYLENISGLGYKLIAKM